MPAIWTSKNKHILFGPELVTNGTLDSNLDSWSHTSTMLWSSGYAYSNLGDAFMYQNFTLQVGHAYRFVFDYYTLDDSGEEPAGLRLQFGAQTAEDISVISMTPVRVTRDYVATSSDVASVIKVYLSLVQIDTVIDNISVREIIDWTDKTKHTSTQTSKTKHSSTYTNKTKHTC